MLVDETPVTKAGALVEPSADIRVKGTDNPYVSRGGLKITGAMDALGVSVEGKVVLDVGASTGGFTDVCLRRGAVRVYAVDVGYNQLDYSLRTDARVFCLEKTNARYLTPQMLPGLAELVVMDVSFISITKIIPALVACLVENGEILAMVKPQFEVGREKVGKGGVVRDDSVREEAVALVVASAVELGFTFLGRADSQVPGPRGNREIFVHLIKSAPSADS